MLAVSALAFLGFCIGKPLLDYLGNMDKEPKTQWTPAASYSEQQENAPSRDNEPSETSGTSDPANSSDGTETAQSNAAQDDSSPEELPRETAIAYEAPTSALANRTSLSAMLVKAKAAGYDRVVVQLKDNEGYLHYKTSLEDVTATRLVKETMTLGEIVSVFTENEMTPVAKISVLADNAGCELFSGMNYKCKGTTVSWLDYTNNPPLRWSNPEMPATREYFSRIVGEISAAGIENIVLTDVVFPNFQNYDKAYIEDKYYDKERFRLLYNVIKAGNIIEIKAADIMAESYGRTAEVLYDTSLMHENSIALVINRKDLPPESGFPADAQSLVEYLTIQCSKKAGSVPIIPVIESSSFGDTDTARIVEKLS